ncbi:MAG: DUF4331 domain-containing protein, partial [Actinomycetota bacterium]|nr:DUF4331 domain-containing protein [Actinomycetota bacterium]
MSSHREAPEISNDPVADNTDTYAFVSPDRPDTVTILTNYIPLEAAAAGPNFYEFGDDVLYYIYISNSGTGLADIAYQFRFTTKIRNENTFLYNTGPIGSLGDPHFNRRQTYSVTRIKGNERAMAAEVEDRHRTKHHKTHHPAHSNLKTTILARNLASPPCNIGPNSTPNYPKLAQAAVHDLPGGIKVFAGQRNDGFFADLGAVFDLADLRPFQNLHLGSMMAAASGIDTLKSGTNVHTIALQIPISELTRDGSVPKNPMSSLSTIGIWGAASRRKMQVRGDGKRKGAESGPWVQVSRLANPLFNEVLVPLGRKDEWNRGDPIDDEGFTKGVLHPELAALLPVLYPGVFPNLAKLNASKKPRADIEAVFLTGIPKGIVPGFQNYTGKHPTDMLRLNVAIPPTASPNALGLLGNDPAGFPNGRRVNDDIVTIELRALAGVTYALVDKSFAPDAAAGKVTQGVATPPTGPPGTARFLPYFPYLG